MEKQRFQSLVDKYTSGSATEGEKRLVEEYLSRLEGEGSTLLNADHEQMLRDDMWLLINEKTIQQPPKIVHVEWRKTRVIRAALAIAASVIMVIALNSSWFSRDNGKEHVATSKTKPTEKLFAVSRHEVNNSGKDRAIRLQDGSMIVLSDGSEVDFLEPFTHKREIALKGKAYFRVAKDQSRPFSVVSGEITTTALGTEFLVTAFANESRISVRLYEGKVLIQPIGNSIDKIKKDIYLTSGQEFIYENTVTAKIRKFNIKDAAADNNAFDQETALDNPSVPQDTKGSWYMFNNQALEQVFDQLAEMYEVEIRYNKKEIQNIYYIGQFSKSDSVINVLKRIATLNNLTITEKGKTFIITK
jgi:hypothetical protein